MRSTATVLTQSSKVEDRHAAVMTVWLSTWRKDILACFKDFPHHKWISDVDQSRRSQIPVVEKNTKASEKYINNRVVINERDLNIQM